MPIWEADFHEQSYGFRPKRQAHHFLSQPMSPHSLWFLSWQSPAL
jgi:hypothetical protein